MNKSRRLYIVPVSLAFLVLFFYFFYLLTPVSDLDEGKSFSVSFGSSLSEIAGALKKNELIRSSSAFKIYGFFSGSAHLLKPGKYILRPSLGTPAIMKTLVTGPQDVNVIIKEGMTLRDIDYELSFLGIIETGELENFPIEEISNEYDFLAEAKILEGFLFPDTYRILPGSEVREVIEKFLDNFNNKAAPKFRSESGELFSGWYANLILASLIEREVITDLDRRLVAGIFNKRLAIGMPLQVDASVVYASCDLSFKNCSQLTKSDFQVKSSYNTYLYKGLPPTPISNPGLLAIESAINPEKSQYLYYLSDPETKKTVFSATLEEHNLNRQRYLQF